MRIPFLVVSLGLLGVQSQGAPWFSSRWSAQGDLSGFASTMPAQRVEAVNATGMGAELRLDTVGEWGRRVKSKLGFWLLEDPGNKSVVERTQFELKDLSLEWKRGSTSVKGGVATLSWEGTDFLNPMELLHAKNWRDPLNSQVRGSAGLFYSEQWKQLSWDVVYIPKQSKSVLPGENSPWWPRHFSIPLLTDSQQVLLPEAVTYQVLEDEELNHALDHNVALRLQYHGDGWDFSLAGFEGSASAPLLVPRAELDVVSSYPDKIYRARSLIGIRPLYYRQRVAAAALAATMGSWIFRWSGQNSQPLGDDSLLPSWSHFSVFEIEKALSFWHQEPILLIEVIAAKRAQSEGLSMLSGLLERSVMCGWRWPLGEKAVWTSGVFQEQKTKSYFVHQQLSWKLSDQWSQNFQADILGGATGSTLGVYDDNDRFRWSISRSF